MSVDAPSSLDLNRNIVLKFEEPVEHIDTAAIHMAVKVDSLWEDIPFILMADSVVPRQYQILADWQTRTGVSAQDRFVGYQGYLRTLYQQGGKPVEGEDP